MLGSAIGFKYSAVQGISFEILGASVTYSGLAISAIVGILLNAVLPGKDFAFVGNGKDTVPPEEKEQQVKPGKAAVKAEKTVKTEKQEPTRSAPQKKKSRKKRTHK